MKASRWPACGALAAACLAGCETKSFFDPSRTGAFRQTPTLIPVLDRIDVIEQGEDYWSRATQVVPEDLIPRELEYQLYPGDLVTVSIFELMSPGQWSVTTRRLDAAGNYRVPEVGDVRAAGLTPQQFEDEVVRVLQEKVMPRPQVDVVVEEAGGLRYTIFGFLQNPGMYNLQNPDLRLLDALAIARGVPLTTEYIYVIRTVPLTEDVRIFQRGSQRGSQDSTPSTPQRPTRIEDLIERLPGTSRPAPPGATPPSTPPDIGEPPAEPRPISPGMLRQDQVHTALVDVDQLEPARVPQPPPVDIEQVRPQPNVPPNGGDSFIYVEERGEWVRVPAHAGTGEPLQPVGALRRSGAGGTEGPGASPSGLEPQMVTERIIEIPYQRLAHGDMSLNIVIRPNDRIYVDGPPQGFVYIDGEISRPGVYSLPSTGNLTISRFIAASGGFGPVAIPERVDLTRKVGPNREATVRLDLGAIRNRTEPDIVLKPDDHIIIGTSWIATPLAIIRNGFRATYGFGFLLDRNFGTDVFGVPKGGTGF